jgi:hypothetical protein
MAISLSKYDKNHGVSIYLNEIRGHLEGFKVDPTLIFPLLKGGCYSDSIFNP